uniref:Uncharacterized protein n=1 Tax=Candidatus Kentrum sp. FW TaxID=2126338 RepID=A0A450SXB1_9GAMM|nr:MAG: hypothetical protein BECKFW1821B_GA0114236_104314 [Candidatus Kentron sp. FW]
MRLKDWGWRCNTSANQTIPRLFERNEYLTGFGWRMKRVLDRVNERKKLPHQQSDTDGGNLQLHMLPVNHRAALFFAQSRLSRSLPSVGTT